MFSPHLSNGEHLEKKSFLESKNLLFLEQIPFLLLFWSWKMTKVVSLVKWREILPSISIHLKTLQGINDLTASIFSWDAPQKSKAIQRVLITAVSPHFWGLLTEKLVFSNLMSETEKSVYSPSSLIRLSTCVVLIDKGLMIQLKNKGSGQTDAPADLGSRLQMFSIGTTQFFIYRVQWQ